jgi:hypothetical protein
MLIKVLHHIIKVYFSNPGFPEEELNTFAAGF